MRSVLDGRVVRGGVAVGLTGLVLALSSPGTASATPAASVTCDPLKATSTSLSVDPGTQVTLTLLGVPIAVKVFTASGPLTGTVNGLLGIVCKVAVTVTDPVVAAVPTAVTDPVASAVAPVASAVAAAPPVVVPVPAGGSVQVGGGPAPVTSPAPTPGSSGGSGGTTPGSGSGGGTAPAAGGGTAGVTGSVQGAAGSAVLPAAGGTAGATGGSAGTGSSGASGYLPATSGRPSVFGSPLLAGYTTSGSAAQFGSLGSIPVATAASESSVQALDSQLGSRPGLVVFAAVLALAAVAGLTVRQWVLRAVPSLAVAPVTKAAHRR